VSEAASPTDATAVRREVIALIMRFLAGLVIVSVLAAGLGYAARAPAEALARAFVTKLGLSGFAVGTLLADGLQFPVPPQFYMLLGVASGVPALHTFATIATASIVAGCLGFYLAQLASHISVIARATARYRQMLGQLSVVYGYRAPLIASLLPIPFSVLCAAAGLNRMPRSFIALVCLCRVPKLLVFFWLVQGGWALFTAGT
jgi:membrane protein YqaA with SNARE-associated domain